MYKEKIEVYKPTYFVIAVVQEFGETKFKCYIRHGTAYTIATMYPQFVRWNIDLFQNIKEYMHWMDNGDAVKELTGTHIDLKSFPFYGVRSRIYGTIDNSDRYTVVQSVIDESNKIVAYDLCDSAGGLTRINSNEINQYKLTNEPPNNPDLSVKNTDKLTRISSETIYEDDNYIYALGLYPRDRRGRLNIASEAKDEFFESSEIRKDCWSVVIKNIDKFNPLAEIPDTIHGLPVVHADKLFAGMKREYVRIPNIKEHMSAVSLFALSEINTIDLTLLSDKILQEIIADNYNAACYSWILNSNIIMTNKQWQSIAHGEYSKQRPFAVDNMPWDRVKLDKLNVDNLLAKCRMLNISRTLFIVGN